jgi:hypothetical protein
MLFYGCGDDSGPGTSNPLDGAVSLDGSIIVDHDAASQPPTGDASISVVPRDGGLQLAVNGEQADPGPGALYITASGEALAVTGYAFPPTSADDTFLVDGWIFTLTHEIVTFDQVKLWEQPDKMPGDQSVHGDLVAHLDGPWAVDLHKGGSLQGEGGGDERAQPFAAIRKKDNGAAFDTTQRYAIGFDIAPASAGAKNVNLDAEALMYYESMIANGYSVMYVGSVSRPASDPCSSAVVGSYDFSSLPKNLPFRLGFKTPASYVNCQNGSAFQGVPGLNGEDHLRGVQFRPDRSTIAQLTAHADHPFWESFAEESALRFDPIAAQYVGVPSPVATLEDMRGVDFTAFTDKRGRVLPMRSCVDAASYTPRYPVGEQLHFDPLKVPVSKSGTDPAMALRDFYDYVGYTQSTYGHINSQGLCFVSRNYKSPPGGS